MGEATNMNPNLNDERFRLNEIIKIKYYFIAEIHEKELMSKRLSKYTSSFDCFNKSLGVSSATSRDISIVSFATVIGASGGLSSASLSFSFSITAETVEKTIKNNTK